MGKYSEVTHESHITIVKISRPEVYNALHTDAHFELAQILDEYSSDPDQWVAIITGAGDKAFCAGNDLKWRAQHGKIEWAGSGFGGMTSRYDCEKPIIAAVNGLAVGGGFEMALACDLVIAAENAFFALPEPKVGLAALAGGLQRLPRQIGLKRAMDIILTGRKVSSREGLEFGFVNKVVLKGEALAVALEIARSICEASPLSIRASKQAVHRGMETSLKSAMQEQMDYPAVQAMASSADAIEGPKAFSEKRAPKWRDY